MMHSCADEGLLTGLLRDAWGFEGVVVSDYSEQRVGALL